MHLEVCMESTHLRLSEVLLVGGEKMVSLLLVT